jgi:hypothetical protein
MGIGYFSACVGGDRDNPDSPRLISVGVAGNLSCPPKRDPLRNPAASPHPALSLCSNILHYFRVHRRSKREGAVIVLWIRNFALGVFGLFLGVGFVPIVAGALMLMLWDGRWSRVAQ